MAMALKHTRWGSTSPRWPNPSNTGTIPYSILTPYTGGNVVTDGITIENRIVDGGIEIRGSNVTFYNCRFQGFGAWGILQLVDPPPLGAGSHSLRVERCTFDAGGVVGSSAMGVGGGDCVIRGCDISGVTLGIQSFGAQTIAGNYLHDFISVSEDPDDRHFDGITVYGGGGVTIENNAIAMPQSEGGTAAVFIANRFSAIDNVAVRSNLLIGRPAYTLYLEDAHGDTVTGVTIEHNHIQHGIFGPSLYDVAEAPSETGTVTWEEDVDARPDIVTAWLATV